MDGAVALAELKALPSMPFLFEERPPPTSTMPMSFVSRLGHQACGVRADVAETLHNHAGRVAIETELLDGLLAHDQDAPSSGLATAARSADVDGLASNYRRDRLPHVHGIRVHDPSHGLFVGIHVGCGNVFFGTDKFEQLGGIAAVIRPVRPSTFCGDRK